MPRQIQGSQTDFSFGEVDPDLKRNDKHPARLGGLRQMLNARIHNSGVVQNRSGRRALYPTINNAVRTERFLIAPGKVFDIQFSANRVKIIDATGTTVGNFLNQGNGGGLPWASAADIQSIVYAVLRSTITITFGNAMRPQQITFDNVASWTIADFTEAIFASGQKRTLFYRLSPQNISIQPSATIGNITVTYTAPIVTAAMVGTRIRFCNRQILLTSVASSTVMNATVAEPLPPGVIIPLTASSLRGNFAVGDLIIGASTGAQGIVSASPTTQTMNVTTNPSPAFPTYQVGDAVTGSVTGATGIVSFSSTTTNYIQVQLTTPTGFSGADNIIGPRGTVAAFNVSPINLTVQMLQSDSGSLLFFIATEEIVGPSGIAQVGSAGPATTVPQSVSVWDDEVINPFRGYPASCFTDQFRLGFTNFSALPGAIAWSAINSPTDLYVGGNPSDAMFEIVPDKSQVYYVVPGPESSEFVICDRKIYYIPISPTNPLKSGSVSFQILSGDGAAQVQPRLAQEAILYVNAGRNSMMAIIASGAYYRPFNTKNLSDYHSHLFNNIQAIAAPSADGTFNERYAYVLNGDGSIAVGKYSQDSLLTNAPVIGWGPWNGVGVVSWIHALAADIVFTSSYGGSGLVEVLDDTRYLDASIFVNAAPAAFAPPGGKGPLWFLANQTVTLMDQGTRPMGPYQIDANGFIVPQNNGGENLAAASLVAGHKWSGIVEPFAPDAQSGADMKQRMELRQFSKFAVYVLHSTGLIFQSLFSAKQTSKTPALGTVQQYRRVPAYNIDDDATLPPVSRETVESWTPPGSSYDPRCGIAWDLPGQLTIEEIAMEVSS